MSADDKQLADIRQRWNRATPGPWKTHTGVMAEYITGGKDSDFVCTISDDNFQGNREAIANAPSDIQFLLKLVDGLCRKISVTQ